MTPMQRVFDQLALGTALSTTEISHAIGLARGTVSKALLRLRKQGLIEWYAVDPVVKLKAGAVRPVDRRGRKPQ